ncbi:hypothetical protein WLQ65_01605 [Pseudoalteromonas piscicida]|uniref:hypothetical protein n=1 Tax=Pseudoalteromonas piscicida TaxID=43662 RepID=UPI0030C8E373
MNKSLDLWWDRLLKLIELLRPKFYNKLTWLIVISGLGLMSKPLWLTLINLIFETGFQFSITEESDTAWGFCLVLVGLIYHLINTGLHEFVLSKKEKIYNLKRNEHDIKIFQSLNAMIDETYINNLFDYMHTSDAIMWDDFQKLRNFLIYTTETTNQFVDGKLKQQMSILSTSLNDLLSFINKEFDEYPYGQAKTNFRMCLAPQLNCDRAGAWEDGPKYDSLVQQMMDKSSALITSYKEWRLAIKEALLV